MTIEMGKRYEEAVAEVELNKPQMSLVMIGGGIGITLFLSLVTSEAFTRRDGKSTLIYAVPDRSAAVYLDELHAHGNASPRLDIHAHLSEEAGYVDRDYIESIIDKPIRDCLFMVCGPPALMSSMRSLRVDARLSGRPIIIEDFEIR